MNGTLSKEVCNDVGCEAVATLSDDIMAVETLVDAATAKVEETISILFAEEAMDNFYKDVPKAMGIAGRVSAIKTVMQMLDQRLNILINKIK